MNNNEILSLKLLLFCPTADTADTAPTSVLQSYPSAIWRIKEDLRRQVNCMLPQIKWRARPILYGLKWHSGLYHRYAKNTKGVLWPSPPLSTLSNEPLMLGTIRLDSHSAHGARRNEVVGALNNLCGIYSQRAGYFLFSLGGLLPVAFNPQHSYNTMHSLTNWPKAAI